MIKRSVFFCLCAWTTLWASGPLQAAEVDVTVHAGARQAFQGFGCSMLADDKLQSRYAQMPATIRSQMADMLYKGLRMNTLRMWLNLKHDSDPQTDLQTLSNYVKFGLVDEAKSRGVDHFLLAPAQGPRRPSDPQAYGRSLADMIKTAVTTYGIPINETGLTNEPNVNYRSLKDYWSHDDINQAIISLRQQLDADGLGTVGIVAPESSNADKWATECMQAIKDNPAAWNALAGVADHSYGHPPREEQAQIVAGTGKQYWMTESSTMGPEGPANESMAADQIGRFLNDLNHGVDHWIYFIGYHIKAEPSTQPDSDEGTKLMVYYLGDNQLVIHLKYWYFKNAMGAFDYGSVFRHTTSDLDGEMNATESSLVATAAQNPDGTWSIGLVNQSGLDGRPSAQPYTANIFVEELQGAGTIQFKAESSTVANPEQDLAPVTMTGGRLTLTLQPRELVTLRSELTTAGPTPTAATSTPTAP